MDDWEVILEELARIKVKSELSNLIGDLNLHCGDKVPSNPDKTSVRGKLLNNLLESEEYVLVNALNNTIRGPFTKYERTDPTNSSRKSLLDYIIILTPLVKYIEHLEINKELKWTAAKSVNGTLK